MASSKSQHQEAIGVHLAIVFLSGFVSLSLFSAITPLNHEGTAIVGALLGMVICHGIATVLSFFIQKKSIMSCVAVFFVAFFVTGCCCLSTFQSWRYRSYQAVYDRFQDYVTSPIPDSVKNLRPVPLREGICTNLMFRFDIANGDLDAIISKLDMKQIDPTELPNPQDYFQYEYYLPLDGNRFELYQGKDQYGGMLTIKTNRSHTHAIFRKEDSGFYRDQGWNSSNKTRQEMRRKALQRLKARYEAGGQRNPK